MQDFHWTPADNGALVSQSGLCRLTVATIGGSPRFLVHRQTPDGAGRAAPLVASGTRPNAHSAMAAAEAAANRLAMPGVLRADTKR